MPNVFHRLEEKKYRLDSEIDGGHSSGNEQRLGNKDTHTLDVTCREEMRRK